MGSAADEPDRARLDRGDGFAKLRDVVAEGAVMALKRQHLQRPDGPGDLLGAADTEAFLAARVGRPESGGDYRPCGLRHVGDASGELATGRSLDAGVRALLPDQDALNLSAGADDDRSEAFDRRVFAGMGEGARGGDVQDVHLAFLCSETGRCAPGLAAWIVFVLFFGLSGALRRRRS